MEHAATVAERLRDGLQTLTPTERRAATTLLGHYPMAGLESVTQFARRAGVSPATALRLVAKLGFTGYADFQEALRDEVAARLQSPLGRWQEAPPAASARQDFLARYAERAADNLRHTVEHLPRAAFDRAVELLCREGRSVHVLGGRFTGRLAGYLAAHLRAMRPGVHEVEGQSSTWPDQLLSVGRNDTVVAFDIRRYQPDVAAFASRAAGRGARVVLFTDAWNSPIAGVADPVLVAHTESGHGWDSLAALLVVEEALIAAVADRLGPRFAERMGELEDLRRRWSGPMPDEDG